MPDVPRSVAPVEQAAPRPSSHASTSGLLLEEPQPPDTYNSSSPNRYVRFYATNVSASTVSLRVTGVEVKHGVDSIPIRVAAVRLDDGSAGQPIAIGAGERHLVTVSLDDSAHVLAAIHDDVGFAITVDANGSLRSVATQVWHMTRWPARR